MSREVVIVTDDLQVKLADLAWYACVRGGHGSTQCVRLPAEVG